MIQKQFIFIKKKQIIIKNHKNYHYIRRKIKILIKQIKMKSKFISKKNMKI
jgi:hypothetical protein